jgi:hypothetical protein
MAVDLGLTVGTSAFVTVPPNALLAGQTAMEKEVAAHLAPGARFDVYNPQGYGRDANAESAGLPDDNVLARLPSVGGYASIVSGSYDARTLTHDSGQLNVSLLGTGKLDELDLTELVTAPEYFLIPLRSAPTPGGGVDPISEASGTDAVVPMGIMADVTESGYPSAPPSRPARGSGQSSRWFFGQSLRPAHAGVLLASAPTAPVQIRFGTVSPQGATRWADPVTVPAGVHVAGGSLPSGPAVGMAVEVLAGTLPAQQATITVGPRNYELDGTLAGAVRPGRWRQQATIDGYTLFVRQGSLPAVYAVGAGGTEAGAGAGVVRISETSSGANTASFVVRSDHRVVLVRGVAWDAGWHATLSVDGGPGRSVRVVQRGLVQQVSLPAGTDAVTFAYRPPHWALASTLSALATLLLLALLAAHLMPRRRRLPEVPILRDEEPSSAEGVGQREEELALVGAPHGVDHEAGGP